MAISSHRPTHSPPLRVSNRTESELTSPENRAVRSGLAHPASPSHRSGEAPVPIATLALRAAGPVGAVGWRCLIPWKPRNPALPFVVVVSPSGYEFRWWGCLVLWTLGPCGLALVAVKAVETLAELLTGNSRHSMQRIGLEEIRLEPLSCSEDQTGSGELPKLSELLNRPSARRSTPGSPRELAQ